MPRHRGRRREPIRSQDPDSISIAQRDRRFKRPSTDLVKDRDARTTWPDGDAGRSGQIYSYLTVTNTGNVTMYQPFTMSDEPVDRSSRVRAATSAIPPGTGRGETCTGSYTMTPGRYRLRVS